MDLDQEEFDDTKELIRIHISNIDNMKKQLIMYINHNSMIKCKFRCISATTNIL